MSAGAVRFEKWEGLGNDFVVLEDVTMTPEIARLLCDRRRGVGADGVLVVERTPPRMRVWNADGSRPEMCGNGLRCVALHLAIGDGLDETRYVLDTDAGIREALVVRSGERGVVTLDMGNGELGEDHRESHAGQSYKFLRVSMGNPHAIVFDASFDERAMDEIYQRFIHERPTFDDLTYQKKKLIMQVTMASDVNVLGHQLNRLVDGRVRRQRPDGFPLRIEKGSHCVN